MDRQCLQCRTDVHWAVHGLPRWIVGGTQSSIACCDFFHGHLCVSAILPQLCLAAHGASRRGPDFRNLLSADANVRVEEHSAALPSVYPRALRQCSRWRCEHSSITLRLVSRSPLLPLDVLGLCRPHTHHGPLHLLRRSRSPTEKIRCLSAQLRGVPIRQRWLRAALCGAGSRSTARLVALRPLHRAILRRCSVLARVANSPSTQPQPPR